MRCSPKPQSGEDCCSPNRKAVWTATHYQTRAWQTFRDFGCNTLAQLGLANVNTEKNVISFLLYTFLSSTLGLISAAVYSWE